MPPPITTTSAEPGSFSSLTTGCTGGDIGAFVQSGLAERGDAIDVADEQDTLFVDRGIAQPVGRRVAGVFRPDLVELPGDALAAGFPFALLALDRAFELDPVVGVVRVDDQERELGVLADPAALRPVRGGIDQYLVSLVVEPHRRQPDA